MDREKGIVWQKQWWGALLWLCLVVPSAVRGAENPAQSKQAELVGRLEEIGTAMDDVVVEFYQRTVTAEEAKRRLSTLMNTWLDLYLKLSKGRRHELLGRLELDFFNRINRDREPFIRRYSEYVLGDKEAFNEGEIILLDRLVDSVKRYSPLLPPEVTAPPGASPSLRSEQGVKLPQAEGSSR